MTGDLPGGWEVARLGALGTEVRGQTAPESGTTYDLYSVPAFPTGQPEQVDGESIRSGKRPVEEHDVLLCKINPRINRVWVVGPSHGLPQIASTEYLVLRPNEPRMAAYLRHYLSSPRFRDWIRLAVEGATGSHTRAKSGPILDQLVPVPPLAEQQRIALAIEEHFSRLDAIDESMENVERRIAVTRRSVLVDAFSGRLVPQDPGEESALPSMQHTAASAADKSHQMTGRVPSGWAWARFDEVAETQLGKMLSAESRQGLAPVSYLRNQNVQWHRIDLSDVASMDFTDGERAKYQLRPGDLLVCEGGEVGRTAMWTQPTIEMCFQKALHRVRTRPGIEARWIEYFMRWSAETGRFEESVQGSTIAHLPQRDLRALMVPIPSSEEQRRIVASMEEHFARLHVAQVAVTAAKKNLEAMRRSVLTAAFSGRLVPQNPHDNSESDRLESAYTPEA